MRGEKIGYLMAGSHELVPVEECPISSPQINEALRVIKGVTRHRRWLSAVLLGLAVADRQTAWFVAPFFLLAVADRAGPREALWRGAVALAVALAVNAPFVLGAPERAVGGMLAPMFAPLQADGVGLMQLGVTDRYTTILPRVFYTVVSVAALALLLVVAWRRPRALAGAPLVFPFVPLWLAWRSLQNYFAFVPLFALAADDEIADDADATRSPAPPPAGPRTSPRSPS